MEEIVVRQRVELLSFGILMVGIVVGIVVGILMVGIVVGIVVGLVVVGLMLAGLLEGVLGCPSTCLSPGYLQRS